MGQTLLVDTTFSIGDLVQNVLVAPQIQVSNIQFTGDSSSIAYFNGVESNIGLGSGLIMSTGKAFAAEGPNNQYQFDDGTDFNLPGDSILELMLEAASPMHDASILEFDFVSDSDSLFLRYVFASNEYMAWIGTTVTINDAFAFLLSGPGLLEEQNLAFIPGTQSPVTTDNVNANFNQQFYVDNGDEPSDTLGQSVSYNGFTVPLTASTNVVHGETYHVRLIISDGADGFFDSAIFLQWHGFTQSFTSLDIHRTDGELEFSVYPNPTTSTITLKSKTPLDQAWLTDLMGRRIMPLQLSNNSWQADLGHLPNGMYLMDVLTYDGKRGVRKIVKD